MPLMANLRMARRLALLLAWTLPCAAIQSVLLRLPGRGKERFARVYWSGVRRILGLRITVLGRLPEVRPVLFAVNHSSWLDIIALGSVLPACFVAKGEVGEWPGFRVIARLGRTVFVSRKRAGVRREGGDMLQRLAEGDNLILFPEGTTSDGCRVRRFESAFFALTQGETAPYVQPVTLVYDRIEGLPVRRRDRPMLSWYGDMDLLTHFPAIARLGSFHATLVLDAVIPPAAYANRKQLCAALEARIAANAAALRQGRRVTPLDRPPAI